MLQYSPRQVASLSGLKTGKAEAPHYVCSVKHATETEVKCDCPVYRNSPNICQHALAIAEDLQVLSDYLLWVKRTKKGPNLSQLMASSVPKDGGQKPVSRRKGNPKQKKSEDITITKPLMPASVVCTTSFTSTEKSVSLHDNHTIGTASHSSLLMLPSSCSSLSPVMLNSVRS